MKRACWGGLLTYYPQKLSILRLDRPQLRTADDQLSSTLFKMLPPSRRLDANVSATDSIKALTDRLKAAEALGDRDEEQRVQKRIVDIAMGKVSAPSPSEQGLLQNVSPDTEKAIKESLAFRGTVTTVPVEEKVQTLVPEIQRLKTALGLDEVLYVDDLPVITATYGFTRRHFEPTYEELNARNLPVEIRFFPAVQKFAAQALGRTDLVGTIPILAREGEHEGIFLSLKPDLVIRWLEANGIALPNRELPGIARIIAALEPVERLSRKSAQAAWARSTVPAIPSSSALE